MSSSSTSSLQIKTFKDHFKHFDESFREAVFKEVMPHNSSKDEREAVFKEDNSSETSTSITITCKRVEIVGKLISQDRKVMFKPADESKFSTFADVLAANHSDRNFYIEGKALTWLLLRADEHLPASAMLYAEGRPSRLPRESADVSKLFASLQLAKDSEHAIGLHTQERFSSAARSITLVHLPDDRFITVTLFDARRVRSFRSLETALVYANATAVSRLNNVNRLDLVRYDSNQIGATIEDVADKIRAAIEARSGAESDDAALRQAAVSLREPESVNVSVVLVGEPSAGKSTILKRLLADGDGRAPVVEGTTNDNNTKLPIRYERSRDDGNAVFLKFCSADEFSRRVQTSGNFLIDYIANYDNKERCVETRWLSGDAQEKLNDLRTQKGLEPCSVARKLDLGEISIIVGGIVRLRGNDAYVIDDALNRGMALLAAIDFVCVQCDTCLPQRVYWDTPGLPEGAQFNDAGTPLIRRIDNCVNRFVRWWRVDNKLVAQPDSVCDVVMQVVRFDGHRTYATRAAQDLFATCGLFNAVVRGFGKNDAPTERVVEIVHQVYAHVHGAPQLAVVLPRINLGDDSSTAAGSEVLALLDSFRPGEFGTEIAAAIADMQLPAGPTNDQRAAQLASAVAGMPLLARHYSSTAHLLALPRNDMMRNHIPDLAAFARRRIDEMLTAAARKWCELRLFRSMVDRCNLVPATPRKPKSVAVLSLTELQSKSISIDNCDEFDDIEDADDHEVRDLYIARAIDMVVKYVDELIGTNAAQPHHQSLLSLKARLMDVWGVEARKWPLESERESDPLCDQLEEHVRESVKPWVERFVSDGNALIAAAEKDSVRNCCETGIRMLEKKLGCVQSTAADAFARPVRGGQLEALSDAVAARVPVVMESETRRGGTLKRRRTSETGASIAANVDCVVSSRPLSRRAITARTSSTSFRPPPSSRCRRRCQCLSFHAIRML